jgi:hypothetical protein
VDAENFAVFCVRNNFDKTFVRSDDGCPRIRRKRKLADFYVVALFACLRFGQANAADFGMTISHVGDS